MSHSSPCEKVRGFSSPWLLTPSTLSGSEAALPTLTTQWRETNHQHFGTSTTEFSLLIGNVKPTSDWCGDMDSICQKVNEKFVLYFAGGGEIKIFRTGDVFFSCLLAAEIEHQATGLQELACPPQVWLGFIWKVRKLLLPNTKKFHLELSFTVQKWRWLLRATQIVDLIAQ